MNNDISYFIVISMKHERFSLEDMFFDIIPPYQAP